MDNGLFLGILELGVWLHHSFGPGVEGIFNATLSFIGLFIDVVLFVAVEASLCLKGRLAPEPLGMW